MKYICLAILAMTMLVLFGNFAQAARRLPACPIILTANDAITSSIEELYRDGKLTTDDLIAIRNGQNPLVNKRGSDAYTFAPVVETLAVEIKKNPNALVQLDEFIDNTNVQQRERADQEITTKTASLPMEMYPIRGGTFIMGDFTITGAPPHKVKVSTFYVANIPVTQFQWVTVMKKNPSEFKTGGCSVDIDGKRIFMRPNNPVEGVRWKEVAGEFLPILNQWSKDNDPRIYQIISNHIPHAHIRLLTEAEWEFLATNRGAWKGPLPNVLTTRNVHEYVHFGLEKDSTNPVAELRPLMIAGHPFYDLFGNVGELVQDTYHGMYGLKLNQLDELQIDPIITDPDGSWVYRGGDWTLLEPEIGSRRRGSIRADGHHERFIGLRLAEDPPP